MARRPVVLLAESHTSAEHHRWQVHAIAALHARDTNMVLGFEMFPRRVQPILDRWVAGALTREAFLEDVEWDTVWGYDSALYMPLFDFARMHRLPMVALNVDKALVARVRQEGWRAIPAEDREGRGRPGPGRPRLPAEAGANLRRPRRTRHQGAGPRRPRLPSLCRSTANLGPSYGRGPRRGPANRPMRRWSSASSARAMPSTGTASPINWPTRGSATPPSCCPGTPTVRVRNWRQKAALRSPRRCSASP